VARAFDDASSQYLEYAGAVVAGYPLSMACWAYYDDSSISQVYMSLGHSSDSSELFAIRHSGTPLSSVLARTRNDAAIRDATSPLPDVNTWAHIAGTFEASSSYAYTNGVTNGLDYSSVTFPTLNRTTIGVQNSGGSLFNPLSGMVCEGAIWNAILTLAEIQILAAGYSPLLVMPQNLVAYWPLIRDTDDDIVGGYSMTPVNSPTVAAHPRVLYPIGPYMVPAAAAIAALRIPRHPAAYYGGPTVF